MAEFIQLAPQFALVIIVMWFVLELGKRSDKQMRDINDTSSKTLEVQNARYMEAISLQNDQYKASLNDMNDHYLKAMSAQTAYYEQTLDKQTKHYEEALNWRDNMLKEQREADRAAIKEVVAAISRLATLQDRHDRETAEAIASMKARVESSEHRQMNKPKEPDEDQK